MRRNRQKLHRELRLKAEAHQRRRREVRQKKKAARAAAIAAAERVLRSRARASATPAHGDAVLASIRELLRLGDVPTQLARRVVRVYGAVRAHLPSLACASQLPWYCLLAAPPWLRTPEHWTPPSGSVARKKDHFAKYLLTRYPVPAFLLRALDVDALPVARVPVEDQWAVHLLARVGRGESVRGAVGTELLPAPLTRKMVHHLLGATASTPPLAALRQAQVRGFKGPARLATTLMNTRLGGLRGADPMVGEPFWHDVVGWLCRTPETHDLSASELDDVLRWFERSQRCDGPVRLKGRTLAAILRDLEEQRKTAARSTGDEFPDSGLLPLARGDWSIDPVRTPTTLHDDATQLKNCAWQYRKLVRKRKVALFVLHRDGATHAMIEVALGAARVVQARRACNERLLSADRQCVLDWAQLNRLAVRSPL